MTFLGFVNKQKRPFVQFRAFIKYIITLLIGTYYLNFHKQIKIEKSFSNSKMRL